MKFLDSFLIIMIALHGACMARCVGERAGIAPQTAAPPCHSPHGTPDGQDSPAPSTTCSEGPVLESKTTSFFLKCSLDAVTSPGIAPDLAFVNGRTADGHDFGEPEFSPPLLRLHILRI